MRFKRFSQVVDDELYNILVELKKNNGTSLAEEARKLMRKGLASKYVDESGDIIAEIVREEMEVVIKPHIERLARLSAKSGHMSATAAFLNVQALMDLVPNERRKDVRPMYESARKKAVKYMRTNTEEWRGNELDSD